MYNFTIEQELILDITKNIANMSKYLPKKNLLVNVNWDEFFDLAVKHKIFIMAFKCIHEYIPTKYKAKYECKYFDLISIYNIRMNELVRIIKIADQNEINIVLLKGFALCQMIYGDFYTRQMGDVDLLVNEKDMEKLYYHISELGYSLITGYNKDTKRYNTIDNPILLYRSDFHEMQCIKYISENSYIIVEIKRASSAISIEHINDFLLNTNDDFLINGFKIKTLNFMYSFLHLIANSYATIEPIEDRTVVTYNIRDLIDPYMFIMKYKDEIEWNIARELSEKLKMTHKIFYVLNQLTVIYQQLIPNEIIEIFNPAKSNYVSGEYPDGSKYQWKSDIIFRLFKDEERNREFVIGKKIKFYDNKNYHIDKLQKDSSFPKNKIDLYKHWCLESLQLNLDYVFTYDHANLYFYLMISDSFYEKLGEYYLSVLFIDNNPLSKILNRNIIVRNEMTMQVQFNNLQNCNYQFTRLEDKWFVKISIPYDCLDMNFNDSDYRIYYNIFCCEKIGCDSYRYLGQRYGLNEYAFLKLLEDTNE